MLALLRFVRGQLHRFGGSQIQRDVVEQTLIAVVNRSSVGF